MREIEVESVASYLREVGYLAAPKQAPIEDQVHVEELTGGISNRVFYVAAIDYSATDSLVSTNNRGTGGRLPLVVKQARPQLRTAAPWYCSVERIWREIDFLRACRRPETSAYLPDVLFEDRANYVFGMTAAPRQATTWKSQLLAGQIEPRIAITCGELLGSLHAGSWNNVQLAQQFGERQFFIELRLDPYYRAVADRHPDARHVLETLSRDVLAQQCCLVHADFSPKNLLVWGDDSAAGGLMLVDFETGHFGDPAFDLGFFLSHLVLKSFHAAPNYTATWQLVPAFLDAYNRRMSARISATELAELTERGIRNCAACTWSRLDGVSMIDYLHDPPRRELVRAACRNLLVDPPSRWELMRERFEIALRRISGSAVSTSQEASR